MNNSEYKYKQDLPDWGPYSKEYAGLGHIMKHPRGGLMEFMFVCGFYGGARIVPNVVFDSGYHHWQANHNLSYYSYRYELVWKDRVFADVMFFDAGHDARLVKIAFRNNETFKQQFEVILVASLRESHVWTEKKLLAGEYWIGAESYREIVFWDHYAQDGLNRGVQTGAIFTDNQALGSARLNTDYDITFPPIGNKSRLIKGRSFGLNVGDSVIYDIDLDHDLADAHLYIRYGLSGIKALSCTIKINDISQKVVLREISNNAINFESLKYICIKAGHLSSGISSMQLEITNVKFDSEKSKQQEFILDGFILRSGEVNIEMPTRIQLIHHKTRLLYQTDDSMSGLSFHPKHMPNAAYGVWCEYAKPQIPSVYQKMNYLYMQPVRELYANDIDNQIKRLQIRPGFFQNRNSNTMSLLYRIKPLYCDEKSENSVYLAISSDSDEEQALKKAKEVFQKRHEIERDILKKYEYNRYRAPLPQYAFSQERMMTQLLTNIGYPVQLKGKFNKHYTPGKAWGGLYFWDTGFHALGLAEYSIERAIDAIDLYFTDIDDLKHAFIMHGSPVPMPIHALWQIFQRTGRKEVLEKSYDKAKRMVDFLAGKVLDSRMDKFNNGLLSSYEYFYNAAGWDDYPAQAYIHATFNGDICLADNVACAGYPSHVILAVKLIRLMAFVLDKKEDIEELTQDIDYITNALQVWSWDERAGYFSYVINDTKEHFYYDQNTNFNMGLDGCLPLMAGITTDEQTRILVEKLKDPQRLWTNIGLTAVDQSAPYFTYGEGYWNGRVWMPYNWLFWKTMLTLGELQFAAKIAKTCLDVWNKEVNRSYNIWENFIIQTERGAGCSQFAALSAPVIEFCNAYYKPGRITTGFNTIVYIQEYDAHSDKFECVVNSPFRKGVTSLLVVMGQGIRYLISINGKRIEKKASSSGLISLKLKLGEEMTKIQILPSEAI